MKNAGKVAVCGNGRVGIIKKLRSNKTGTYYEGVGVFDNKRWISRHPVIVAKSLKDFNKKKVKA